MVVRHLRGRPVDPGRHAVRGEPRPRGRRAPVDHHPVHRDRAARLRELRASLRHRYRVVPAGQPGPAGPAGRHLGLPAAVHPAGQPEAGRHPGRPRGQGTPPPPGGGRRVPAAPGREAGRDDRGDGRGRARGAGRGRAPRGGRGARRRRLPDQPRAAVPRAARPPGPGAGRGARLAPGSPARRGSRGSWSRRSPRPAPRRWSPSWTGTRTRCRSWPPSTRCRTPPWAWRSSASPGRSRTCTATTASTPTASSGPRWISCLNPGAPIWARSVSAPPPAPLVRSGLISRTTPDMGESMQENYDPAAGRR